MLNTPFEVLQQISKYIRATRLNSNITMEELSKRSDVGIATLARLEKTGVCSTNTFVKILAALGELDRFATSISLKEASSISDLRKLNKAKQPLRARKKT